MVVLLAVMMGLILLIISFENVVEKMLCTIIFFWENKYIKKLSLRNLSIHRVYNIHIK
jgi:hypothetical protein